MHEYLFYPGCSLHRNARSYLDGLMAVRDQLQIELTELTDWNCCGATEYFAIHHLAACALIGRNLALAQQQATSTRTLMAPCSACYMNLAKLDTYMLEDEQLNTQVNAALAAGDLHYDPGQIEIRHLLEVLIDDIGLEAIRAQVRRPLSGLRLAPYYGCMIARPDHRHRWDDIEQPMALDRLLEALGAEVVPYPMKTQCCGGHMTQINSPVAYDLIRRLVYTAAANGADAIAVLCPMCQLNLDAYQPEMNRYFHTDFNMPVVYFTQLMGLAYGVEPELLGFGKEFVSAKPLFDLIGRERLPLQPEESTSRSREALPMPRIAIQKGGQR